MPKNRFKQERNLAVYGFLIKLVSGDRGFLSNVTGEFDELFVVELKFGAKFPIPLPFMEIGEMI